VVVLGVARRVRREVEDLEAEGGDAELGAGLLERSDQ